MKNKVALITGATGGIGEATALLLAEKGVNVAISGRRKELGEKVVVKLEAKGVDAVFFNQMWIPKEKSKTSSRLL